jgi:two-component system, chemotaxis family, protein-glutamate methylesterase/glutaminase
VTTSAPIRVLVVDDSALMRKLLVDMLQSAPEVEVVGTARDGHEAIRQVSALLPDVVTLDVEMPGMSGLEALPRILAIREVPVVMVSVLTQEGAEVTLTALELGAVDFMPKPESHQITQMKASREMLIAKVLAASRCRVHRTKLPSDSRTVPSISAILPAPQLVPPKEDASPSSKTPASLCIALGISTGGPQALGEVLPLIKPPIPPIVVVQHMPAHFTGVFAARLDRLCSVPVKEAKDGDRIVPNHIFIAQGGQHLRVAGRSSQPRLAIFESPPVSGHKPSIDVLFHSVALVYGADAVGILMTGMGRDGVDGCKAILAAGGRTFGQDEATSVVYGMNKVARREGAIQAEFALAQFPPLIERLGKTKPSGAG